MLLELEQQHEIGKSSIIRKIEKAVCGCSYGATSWATRKEANHISRLLRLKPNTHLLEIGAGAGWPGIYLAKKSGCDLTLIDIPLTGLITARNQINKDNPEGNCQVVAADGIKLPFSQSSFKKILHTDLLCCLPKKMAALKSMKTVISDTGQMIFSVIYIPEGLSKKAKSKAIKGAPIFAQTQKNYPDMLKESGWEIMKSQDLSPQYLKSVNKQIFNENYNKDKLDALRGSKKNNETLTYRKATKTALEEGLIKRIMFSVIPKN